MGWYSASDSVHSSEFLFLYLPPLWIPLLSSAIPILLNLVSATRLPYSTGNLSSVSHYGEIPLGRVTCDGLLWHVFTPSGNLSPNAIQFLNSCITSQPFD